MFSLHLPNQFQPSKQRQGTEIIYLQISSRSSSDKSLEEKSFKWQPNFSFVHKDLNLCFLFFVVFFFFVFFIFIFYPYKSMVLDLKKRGTVLTVETSHGSQNRTVQPRVGLYDPVRVWEPWSTCKKKKKGSKNVNPVVRPKTSVSKVQKEKHEKKRKENLRLRGKTEEAPLIWGCGCAEL